MSECLNCGKPIENYTGRRAKKYCSPACKQAYFQKHKAKQPKYVLLSTHKAALERIRSLEAILAKKGSDDTEASKNTKVADLGGKKKPAINIQNFTDNQTTNKVISTEMPVRMPGEDPVDFAARKNEWKKLQK